MKLLRNLSKDECICIHSLTYIYRFSIIWKSLDLSYFFKLASTSKTFPIEFGRIGRWCQTNQGISVVGEDNELKFSKLFLAVWSKVWLECGWGRSVRGGEHVYSTRFPREASENRFRTLKLTPWIKVVLNKSTQTDFKAPLKYFSETWTRTLHIIYE